jgi:prophage tail gpP-like protein
VATTSLTSLKCFVSQQDAANMALYLARPFGVTISAQVISIDGAMRTTM